MPKDFAKAAKWSRKAADQGSAVAQGLLGEMYSSGQGVTQDYAKAVKWLRKAADQGFVPAQLDLAAVYSHGLGVPKDYAETAKWLHKAADKGSTTAQDEIQPRVHVRHGQRRGAELCKGAYVVQPCRCRRSDFWDIS